MEKRWDRKLIYINIYEMYIYKYMIHVNDYKNIKMQNKKNKISKRLYTNIVRVDMCYVLDIFWFLFSLLFNF